MWIRFGSIDTEIEVKYDGKVYPRSIFITALRSGKKFQNKSGYMGLSTH